MTDIHFDPRQTAGIIKQYLIQELHELQDRIIRLERFGVDAVLYPRLGIMGRPEMLDEYLVDHAAKLAQIKALTQVLDHASAEEIKAFVAGVKARRGL